jgi:hypothetical protein
MVCSFLLLSAMTTIFVVGGNKVPTQVANGTEKGTLIAPKMKDPVALSLESMILAPSFSASENYS